MKVRFLIGGTTAKACYKHEPYSQTNPRSGTEVEGKKRIYVHYYLMVIREPVFQVFRNIGLLSDPIEKMGGTAKKPLTNIGGDKPQPRF